MLAPVPNHRCALGKCLLPSSLAERMTPQHPLVQALPKVVPSVDWFPGLPVSLGCLTGCLLMVGLPCLPTCLPACSVLEVDDLEIVESAGRGPGGNQYTVDVNNALRAVRLLQIQSVIRFVWKCACGSQEGKG